ncbi:MAG: DUF1549 domain-containing protein, partial [Armatimonadetes bacterium]|nr:DUF1549 domain-containing protein [Armatimonadota bacterium]
MGSYWGFARGFGTAATVALIGSPLLLLRFHTSSGRPGSRTPTQARVGASAVQSAEGLLQARCASCHSPAERAGGLDLSTPGALLRGGQSGPVVQSGDPEASRLWRRVAGREAPVMPPTGARFTSAEQELLREWIRSEPSPVLPGKSDPAEAGRPVGAPWAFRPLRPVEPPAVQNENWLRNPVDRFLLAELETRKLQPAPEAERTVLLRRVTQDLIGLPPSLPERDAFLADTAPGAYERVVERLLASPHYGERWGRHWLDLASYGDSSGYEADWDRPGAYAYRDFVIRALNQDLPYNTFLRWQLAGDLLEPALPLARAATGFCTSGATISPGYDRKARYEELDDVVSTTGSAMLGLTLGCARCHDHKFDPISQRDYYRLVAVFASSRRTVRTEPAGDGWPGGKLLALEEG